MSATVTTIIVVSPIAIAIGAVIGGGIRDHAWRRSLDWSVRVAMERKNRYRAALEHGRRELEAMPAELCRRARFTFECEHRHVLVVFGTADAARWNASDCETCGLPLGLTGVERSDQDEVVRPIRSRPDAEERAY